ncbi:protein of unknown function [Bradyrhizobium vignae]|uniref:Transposase IS66 central domain-containing protein n=1 Tax=Bradyrhizobium vignae TaxID=1549949 RepID=A0A2U3QA32_9BRAD|nr:protein of unknown function [Bradyrhizobium vignae]
MQTLSGPLAEDLQVYMREQLAKLSHGHDLAKAFNYILKRWASFTLFLEEAACASPTMPPKRACEASLLGENPRCSAAPIVADGARRRYTASSSPHYAARGIVPFMPPAKLCRVRSFSPDFSLTGVWSVRDSSFCASAVNSGEQEDGS